MRINDLFLTLGITAGGDARVLYAGADALAAQRTMAKAGKEYVEVGVCAHPQVVFPRNPQAEAVAAAAQVTAASRRAVATMEAAKEIIRAKNEEAKRLTAEAKELEKSLKTQEAPAPAVPKPARAPRRAQPPAASSETTSGAADVAAGNAPAELVTH